MPTSEEVLSRLNKSIAGKIHTADQIKKDVIPTASYEINKVLGGGFRRGMQHTVWGTEQSSKTSFLIQTIAINQALGHSVAWIDAEGTFDPEWAQRLGCDPSKIIYTKAIRASDITDQAVELVSAGVDLLVLDSLGALIPESFYDKKGEIKQFDDTNQMGQQAQSIGKYSGMIQAVNMGTALVNISQVRMQGIGGMYPSQGLVGGNKYEHADAFRIKFSASKSDNKALKDDISYGDVLVNEKIGIPVDWKINKNKINGKYRDGSYDFYIGGDNLGVDYVGEVVDAGIRFGVIDQAGAWFTVNGERKQGRHNVVKFLRESKDILQFVEGEIKRVESI